MAIELRHRFSAPKRHGLASHRAADLRLDRNQFVVTLRGVGLEEAVDGSVEQAVQSAIVDVKL